MYIGNFAAGSVIRKPFNSEDGYGNPLLLVSPAATVYKDANLTQVATGVSISVDHDGVAGFNVLIIDTSADGSFYAAGSDFFVVMTAGTILGVSQVGKLLAHFSIDNRRAVVSNQVTVATNNDKTGYTLTVTPPTAAQSAAAVRTELAQELARFPANGTLATTSGNSAAASSFAITTGTVTSGTYADTAENDSALHVLAAAASGATRLVAEYNFTVPANTLANLVTFTGYQTPTFGVPNVLLLQAYDWDAASWVTLGDAINTVAGEETKTFAVPINCTDADGDVKLRFHGAAITTELYVDLLRVSYGESNVGLLAEILEAVEAVGAGVVSNLTDIDQDAVPPLRTVVLKPTDSSGLVGEFAYHLTVGDARTFAFDFRQDLAANGKIREVQEVVLETGTAGGITFGTAGRDHTQAKSRITGVTAGTYVVRVTVQYDNLNIATGRATLIVGP